MKTLNPIFFCIILCMLIYRINAQPVPTIIQGGTIHVGNGTIIENGVLVIENGKISFCGRELTRFYKSAKVINAEQKHIYPGLICMNTFLGLNEIDAVRATRDYNETGNINPNVRALVAFNTDSKLLPTASFNGIMLVQTVPQGGLISGQSSVMKTHGWNWEDAQYKSDDGIHLNWPDKLMHPLKKEQQNNQTFDATLNDLTELFNEASRYSRLDKPEVINLRLEAMKGLFDGSKKLYVHTHSVKGIIAAIQFVKKYSGIKMVLVGAAQAYKVSELIRDNNIPVVLHNIHRLPQKNHEDINQPFKTAAQLIRAGITVAIGHHGSWEARNVMFNAGTAAGYGLTKEEALMCITKNAAEVMGIGPQTGTLEVGKDAIVVISTGDILDMRTNRIEYAFLNGEEIPLENSQSELNQKYLHKYHIK